MKKLFVLALAGLLAGCGNDDAPQAAVVTSRISDTSDITFGGADKGPTPFINKVHLAGTQMGAVQSLSYVIEPKPGSASRPVRVSYSLKALVDHGYFDSPHSLALPVIGLYAGWPNPVSVALHFTDSSVQVISFTLTTDAYVDPHGVYDKPVLVTARAPGSSLGFDFLAIKSNFGTPVIIDTDGEMRWISSGVKGSMSSLFTDNGFVIGDASYPTYYRLELDGTMSTVPLATAHFTNFHHNIEPGKTGLLGEFNKVGNVMTTIAEFTQDGTVLKEWDFAKIVSDHMASNGDPAAAFVRAGTDWFHSNSAIVDPSDNSLIVSSRENFVAKVDYETGAIKWILGDPTKYWATFPSLQSKALTLTAGAYPIGQHALSITDDGLLLMFNDGYESQNQPAGAPRGQTAASSTVSAYKIDAASGTAVEAWSYDHSPAIYSSVCSSAYEAGDKSVLIDYAYVNTGTRTRVVGLDPGHQVVFDFEYANTKGCTASWNAMPVPLEDLRFD